MGSDSSTRAGSTVADVMLRSPKVCAVGSSVADLRALFSSDKVHVTLVVDDARLVSVVDRTDLVDVPDDVGAADVGQLTGRVTGPDADLDATWRAMARAGRRRLAVVGDDRRLLGLLCLKRRGSGFCSDNDVGERGGRAPTLRS